MKTKLIVTLALALMATPGFAQKVTVDWDRDYTSDPQTYAWVAPEEAEANPLMHQRIVNAMNYWLTMRGRQEVKPNENPDVYLTYHSDSKDQVVITSDHFGYGFGPGWYWGGGMGTTTSRAQTYTKGTLVIDIWDAKSKNLVFRGTATDTVEANPEKMEKKINKAVEKMFKEFDKKLAKEQKKKSS
jgi:hypothetical protein